MTVSHMYKSLVFGDEFLANNLGIHDTLFQHLYRNVHIRDCHVAGCAIFSILIGIFILLVLYRALSTLDATKRPL